MELLAERLKAGKLVLDILFSGLMINGNAGTFYVSRDGNDSDPGTRNAPWQTVTKAAQTLVAGDTVYVSEGIYNEHLWPVNSGTEDKPVCYFAIGQVILQSSDFEDKWGIFTIKGKENKGFIAPINNIHVRGFTFRGSNHYGICINGGDDGLSGNNCVFENVRCDSNSVGAYFTCRNLKVINSEFCSNKYGGFWVYNGGINIRISGSSFHHNGTKGNVDGMTLQDCENILIEDCTAYGQYDGFDVGSQQDETKGPGCSYIIFRRCHAYNNYNGNYPSSTTLKGPVCYEYCTASDNTDWAGGMVMYEASRNVHIWNCSITRVNIGINFFQGPGPVYLYNNLIVAARNSVINGAGGKIASGNNYLQGIAKDMITGKQDIYSDAVVFDSTLSQEKFRRKYLEDKGEFFLRVTSPGKRINTITVAGDPGIYFVEGDTVQIEGAGLKRVVSMTGNTITLDGNKFNVKSGSGVHLPYRGKAPDIGAEEE